MCLCACSGHGDEEADLRVERDSDGERAVLGHRAPDVLQLGRDSRPPDQRAGEEDPFSQPVFTQLSETKQPHGGGETTY